MSDLPPDGTPAALDNNRERETDSPSGEAAVSFSDVFDRAVTAPVQVAEVTAPIIQNNPLWTSAYEALARIAGHSQQFHPSDDQRSYVRRQDARADVAPAVHTPFASDANRRVLPPPSIQRDNTPPVIQFRTDSTFRAQAIVPPTVERNPLTTASIDRNPITATLFTPAIVTGVERPPTGMPGAAYNPAPVVNVDRVETGTGTGLQFQNTQKILLSGGELAVNPNADGIAVEKLAKINSGVHDGWQQANVTQSFNPSVDLNDMVPQIKLSKAALLADFNKTPDTTAGAGVFTTTAGGTSFMAPVGEAKRTESFTREFPLTQTTMGISQDYLKTMSMPKGNAGINEDFRTVSLNRTDDFRTTPMATKEFVANHDYDAMKIVTAGNAKFGEPYNPARDFGGTDGMINRQIAGEPGLTSAVKYTDFKKIEDGFRGTSGVDLNGMMATAPDKFGYPMMARLNEPSVGSSGMISSKLNDGKFGDFNSQVLTREQSAGPMIKDYLGKDLSGIGSAERQMVGNPFLSEKPYLSEKPMINGLASAGNPNAYSEKIVGLGSSGNTTITDKINLASGNPFISEKVNSLVGTGNEKLAGLTATTPEKLVSLTQNGAATAIRTTDGTAGNVTFSANTDLALTRSIVKPVGTDVAIRTDAAATTLASRAININIEKTITGASTLATLATGAGIKLVMANNVAADTTRVSAVTTTDTPKRGLAAADKVPGATLASATMPTDRVLSDRALASRTLAAPITVLPQQLADRVASLVGDRAQSPTIAARTALLTGETGMMLGSRPFNLPIDRLATTANGTQNALTRGTGVFTVDNVVIDRTRSTLTANLLSNTERTNTTAASLLTGNTGRVISFAPERALPAQPAAALGERAVAALGERAVTTNPAITAADRVVRAIVPGATERGAAIVAAGERTHGNNGINTDRVVRAIDLGNGDRAGAQPVVGTGRANIRDISSHGVRDGLIDKSNLQIGLSDKLVTVGSKVVALKPLHQISENDKRYLTGIELAAGIVALAAIARARSTEASADDENKEGSDDELQAAQTSDDYDSNVIQRPKHMVQPGETLTTIAEEYYNDANLAWLILSLNKGKVSESWKGDICYVEVNGRQELELPVGEDISQFYKVMAGRFKDKRIVTSVRQSHMDQELVTLAFRNVVGRGRRLQSASS